MSNAVLTSLFDEPTYSYLHEMLISDTVNPVEENGGNTLIASHLTIDGEKISLGVYIPDIHIELDGVHKGSDF